MSQISETEPYSGKQTIVNINNTLQSTQECQEEPLKVVEKKTQKPKKPLSAYFFFVQNYKKDYPNDARQLKELGGMWKELPLDYKEKYQRMQEEDKKRYQQELQEWIQKQPEDKDEDQISKDAEIMTHFPIHRIKFILKHDEEKVTYTKDGYIALQLAVETFAINLLNCCKQQAELNKRKKLVDGDLYQAIKDKDEFEFINCLLPKESILKNGNFIEQQEVLSHKFESLSGVQFKEKNKYISDVPTIKMEKSSEQQSKYVNQKPDEKERKSLANQKNTLLNYFKKI